IKNAIKCLEYKTTTLADCFIQLIKLNITIKDLSEDINHQFRTKALELFNKRWRQFDFELYLLAYFLHPRYRGIGTRNETLRKICQTAVCVWVPVRKTTATIDLLIAQLRAYEAYEYPYDVKYFDGIDTPKLWWNSCKQDNNYIQMLALKIL